MPSSPRAPPAVLTRPRSRFVETDGSFVGSSSSLEVRHRLAATADSASGPSSAWSGRQARKEKEAERKDSKDSRDSRETKDGKDRKNSSHGSEGFDSGNKVAYSPSSTLPTGHVESGPKGRHYKSWPGVPYLQRPIKGDGPWLLPGRNASKWLNLFYGEFKVLCLVAHEGARYKEAAELTSDLAVASVLSTFANAHELGHPAAIPTFLSYVFLGSRVVQSIDQQILHHHTMDVGYANILRYPLSSGGCRSQSVQSDSNLLVRVHRRGEPKLGSVVTERSGCYPRDQ